MFLRRAFVEGRRSALSLTVRPSRTLHARAGTDRPARRAGSFSGASSPPLSRFAFEDAAEDARDNSLSSMIGQFLQAITSEQKRHVLATYDKLVSSVKSTGGAETLLSTEDRRRLQKALILLAQAGTVESLRLLSDAIHLAAYMLDMSANDYAEYVFWRLLSERDLNAAYAWLVASAEMEDLAYASDLPSWHQLLEAAAELSDPDLLRTTLRSMNHHDLQPTQTTSSVIFAALFRGPRPAVSASLHTKLELPPPLWLVKRVISLVASYGVPYDAATLHLITTGYNQAKRPRAAKEAEVVYTTTLGDTPANSQERFNEMLEEVAKRETRERVTRAYKRAVQLGLRPSEVTFLAVMGDSKQLSDLRHWQHVLGIKPTPRVVAELMERRSKDNLPVIEVFKHAMSEGLPFTSSMLHPLVKSSLASRGLEKPTEKAIDGALAFYRRFLERTDLKEEPAHRHKVENRGTADPQGSSDDTTSSSRSKEKDISPDVATYQLLLRALTISSNTAKYLPVAVSLLEDMQKFNIALDSQTAASTLILLMSSSATPAEAFRMYTLIARPKDTETPVLNEEGYVAVLNAFLKLPTWPNGIPSVRLYSDILADMRKYGVRLGPKVYTVLIGQLAKLATAASASGDTEAREQIAQSITRVHNHINLNTSFTPDTALWNQLMDAYQRAGCFMKACRIWQTLFVSAQFNTASVSIILDACAWAQAYDMAVRVYGALMEVGFPMNLKNWNTYLECLCRLDRLDEAMKVLCLEMTGREDGIEPDKESVRILLKFAVKENREGEVRSRIKRFLPKLYWSLHPEG
ncbi:hypothetical protein BV20DRAFT_1110356 [Pilatotrama ljubarskyi]|nr:hypothetical protein BV20DRAFT_1110356 [Pilatotrama ljubarskyi]